VVTAQCDIPVLRLGNRREPRLGRCRSLRFSLPLGLPVGLALTKRWWSSGRRLARRPVTSQCG